MRTFLTRLASVRFCVALTLLFRMCSMDVIAANHQELLTSVAQGNTAEVARLLGEGANVNDKGRSEEANNAFFAAIQKGHKYIVELFIANGVDVNFRDANGITALIVAGTFADQEVLHLLLKEKANVQARNAEGYGVLHFSIANPYTDVMARLVAAGARVNMRSTKTGATPLHIAAKEGHLEAVKWLVAHGADLNPRDKSGRTAVMLALESNQGILAKMMLTKGGCCRA